MYRSVYALIDLVREAWSAKELLLLRDFTGAGFFFRAIDATSTEKANIGVDGSLMFQGSLRGGSRQITNNSFVAIDTSDFIVLVNKVIGSTTSLALPAAIAGKLLYVVDQKGDASTHPIKLTGATVNGIAGDYTIGTDGAWTVLLSDGTGWIAKTI